jgi:hypothetical protein
VVVAPEKEATVNLKLSNSSFKVTLQAMVVKKLVELLPTSAH